MNVLLFMIPFALIMGFGFVATFLFAVRQGQFDDTETPAHRILKDDPSRKEIYESKSTSI